MTERPIFVYKIRESLYLNITNRCTSECLFCDRKKKPIVQGFDLSLAKEPSAEEIIRAVGDTKQYKEVVFCGFGEPTLRLDCLNQVGMALKKSGGNIRLNTNGHGNLIHKTNIVPGLARFLGAVSISLNAENKEKYVALCRPEFGEAAFQGVLDFIGECTKYIPRVVVTVVGLPTIDIKACETIARELGAEFRVREFGQIG